MGKGIGLGYWQIFAPYPFKGSITLRSLRKHCALCDTCVLLRHEIQVTQRTPGVLATDHARACAKNTLRSLRKTLRTLPTDRQACDTCVLWLPTTRASMREEHFASFAENFAHPAYRQAGL